MVEFRKKNNEDTVDTAELFINGKLVNGIEVLGGQHINFKTNESKLLYYLNVTEETRGIIADLLVSELSNISNIDFGIWDKIGSFDIRITLMLKRALRPLHLYDLDSIKGTSITKDYIIHFDFQTDIRLWNEAFSYDEYWNSFELVWSRNNYEGVVGGTSEAIGESFVSIDQISLDNSIAQEVEKQILILKQVHERAVKQLNNKNSEKIISAIFNFPVHLKPYCEQYLLYFGQFLQDLGIETTSILEEEAGKVLFSVTPTNDSEALDKIREALALYLHLPSSPITYNEDFASMRLHQQVENLQHSQRMAETEVRSMQYALRLAQQNIDNQDKLLFQQSSFIEQQNKILEKLMSKSVMIDSAENKEELEKLYEGLEVGYSKWLFELTGIKANFAKIAKTAVRNSFGKEDSSLSILDTDEKVNKDN